MKSSLLFSSIFVVFSLVFIQSAQAQSASDASLPSQFPDVIQEQIDVNQVPDVSQPYGPMTVSVDGYGTDLNAAQISWTLNGKKAQSGIGDKSLSFTMGGLGQTSTVSVTIVPINGLPITKKISITPEYVDILWQADSYTPPLYKGKALFAPQGNITFFALPEFVINGKSIDPKTLVYKWSEDTTVLGDQSGYGRNIITVQGSVIAHATDMQVDVSTLDGTVVGRQIITVNPADSQVLIYENNPLYGVLFNRAITSSFNLTREEAQFEAYPYYFSANTRSLADLSYNWLMNDETINVPPSQHSMLFRNTNNQSGQATISLLVTSATKILQTATAGFSVTFNQITKNFFGQ